MSKNLLGSLSLLLVGILYGLSGVIAKYLSAWLNPYQVIEARFAVAWIIAIFILILSQKKIGLRKTNLKSLIPFAIAFPISAIFFTLSVFHTTVSVAVFSFYIANLVASFILGRFVFNERVTRNKKLALVSIVLAVIALTNPFDNFSLQLGFLFGLLSGTIQAIASTFQKIVSQTTNRLGLVIIQTFTGIVISAAILLVTNQPLLFFLPPIPLLVVIGFGAIFLAISYLFLIGFKYINLNTGSILVSS